MLRRGIHGQNMGARQGLNRNGCPWPGVRIHLAAALLVSSLVAGCTSSSDGGADLGDEAHDDLSLAAPVLYLNLTVGDETHRFTSGGAGHAGHTSGSSGTTTISSANSTSSASAGSNGTATGNGTAGNATGGATGSPGGDAPLAVAVALGASKLPAGTPTSWTLDFGSPKPASGNGTGNSTAGDGNGTAPGLANGTTLPGEAGFTYTEPGTYEIEYSLVQGNATLASLHVAVVVGGNGSATAGPAAGTLVRTDILDESGTIILAPTVALCGEGEGAHVEIAWDLAGDAPDPAGALSNHLLVQLTGDDTNVDTDMTLLGPDGEEIGASAGASAAETIDEEGEFPMGIYTIVLDSCIAVAGGWTVHAEATIVTG